MKKFIVIRAVINGGKTTTAGLLYEQLEENASFKRLFNPQFKELTSLVYEDETLTDFIAILLLGKTLVIIISPGDIAADLAWILDKLDDAIFLKELTGEIDYTSIVIVCCARSQNKEGSTYRMLLERVGQENMTEFWTEWKENEDRKAVKMNVVRSIIQSITETHGIIESKNIV